MTTATTTQPTCHKCEGKGRINAFGHIDAGVCYECKGEGVLPYRIATKGQRGVVEGFIAIVEQGGEVKEITWPNGTREVRAIREIGDGGQYIQAITPKQYAYLVRWDYQIGPNFPW